MDKFLIKTATTSKSDIMTATATGKAQNSTNKIEIKSLATNASYTYTAQKFSGPNAKVNPTSATQDFVYTYKGKAVTVKVGDQVLYGKYSGTEITIDGKEYLIMRNSDIFGTV